MHWTDAESPPRDMLAELRRLVETVRAASDKAGRVAPVAALMGDGAGLAILRERMAREPGPVEAELARLAAMQGLSSLVKTLRKMLVVPVRLVTEGEHEDNDGEPMTLPIALARADVPDLVVPSTWEVSPSGLWRLRQSGEEIDRERVSHQPLFLTARFTDLDTDAVSLGLAWVQPNGRLRESIVGRERVLDARELVKLASAGAPVNSAVAGLLVRWLADLEGINVRLLPNGWASSRCGWLGQKMRYFLCGAELLSNGEPAHDVRLLAEGGGAQLLSYVRSAGTWEGWCKIVSKVAHLPLVMMGIYASSSAPLLRILECDNFILDYSGRSGHGKTSACRVGMSVWGVPEEGVGLIRSWSATATGAERVAVALSDMAMALDDTAKVTDRDKPKIASTLYMIANGSGKVRGTRTGLDQVASWKTVCLSTGEASAATFTQDEGVQARCLTLTGHPFGEGAAFLAEEVRRDLMRHHGHAGPMLVRWLLEHPEKWDMLRAEYQNQIDAWGAHSKNPMARRACKYIAAMQIAAGILHDQLHMPAATVDPFVELWGRVQTVTENADKAAAAFASVVSWAVANRASFWSPWPADLKQPPQGWLGRWDRIPDPEYLGDPSQAKKVDDPTLLCVFPDELHKHLGTLGYQPLAMVSEWLDRGWLRHRPRGRTLRTRVAGSPAPLDVYGLLLQQVPMDDEEEA